MPLDPTTDAIAHFAGLFALAIEEGRARDGYDPFVDPEPDAAARPPLDLGRAAAEAPHDLAGVAPRLDYEGAHHPLHHSVQRVDTGPVQGRVEPLSFAMAPDRAAPAGPVAAEATSRAEVLILPPSSLVAVTVQRNVLTDNDNRGDIDAAGFAPVAPATEALMALADAAARIGPVALAPPTEEAGWGDAAVAAIADLPPAGSVESGPLRIETLRGPEAAGIRVDGQRADEMPDWAAFRPDHLAGRDLPLPVPAGADPDAEDGQGPSDAAPPDPFAGLPGGDGDGDGDGDGGGSSHSSGPGIWTGANVAVNQAAIVSNWLDAPVIAVGGRIVALDAITQRNVVVDRDAVPGPAGAPSGPSAAVNAAEIAQTPGPGAAPGGGGGGDAPAAWSVVRIEGDVTQINWVEQYNFATDHDRAEITLSGRETRIEMGGNELVNAASFWELGFAYDLIVVGGDMIDLAVIEQTNVLLDADTVETGFAGPAAAAAAGPGGAATPGAAAAGRDMAGLPGQGRDGAPADAPARPDAVGTDAGRAADAFPAGISGGDNLAWNAARIETIGADVDAALDAAFAQTLARLADGGRDIAAATAGHALFEGLDLLRVLYVAGDFVTVDRIAQTNVVGDADQVRAARDAFADELQAEVAVIAGSNLLANVAEIVDDGIASTRMAGGEVYSDALIHQAGFVDTAAAAGATVSELASEAIAFLVDGMIAPALSDAAGPAGAAQDAGAPGEVDVMQTVLA